MKSGDLVIPMWIAIVVLLTAIYIALSRIAAELQRLSKVIGLQGVHSTETTGRSCFTPAQGDEIAKALGIIAKKAQAESNQAFLQRVAEERKA